MNTWKPITNGSSLPPIGSEESEHLDFKRDPWDQGDKGDNELARDVAQFANHLGGSILVGADEDDEGRCTIYVKMTFTGIAMSLHECRERQLSPFRAASEPLSAALPVRVSGPQRSPVPRARGQRQRLGQRDLNRIDFGVTPNLPQSHRSSSLLVIIDCVRIGKNAGSIVRVKTSCC